MKFFGEYDGLYWEFNSFKDWIEFHISRLVGKVLGTFIVIIILLVIWDLLTA